jgi:hypothetical protein
VCACVCVCSHGVPPLPPPHTTTTPPPSLPVRTQGHSQPDDTFLAGPPLHPQGAGGCAGRIFWLATFLLCRARACPSFIGAWARSPPFPPAPPGSSFGLAGRSRVQAGPTRHLPAYIDVHFIAATLFHSLLLVLRPAVLVFCAITVATALACEYVDSAFLALSSKYGRPAGRQRGPGQLALGVCQARGAWQLRGSFCCTAASLEACSAAGWCPTGSPLAWQGPHRSLEGGEGVARGPSAAAAAANQPADAARGVGHPTHPEAPPPCVTRCMVGFRTLEAAVDVPASAAHTCSTGFSMPLI